MNFYSFMFGKNQKTDKKVEDVDIGIHNQRYHPNGLNENTHCKYRSITHLGQTPVSDALHYDRIKEGIELEGAKQYLWDTNGVECHHIHGGVELMEKFMFHPTNAKVYDTMGTPVSEEVYKENVCKFFAVVKDINTRIGHIPFDSLIFLPFQIKGTHGVSSLDIRVGTTHESFMSIGDLSHVMLSDRVFHHDDERLPYDIIRHEIGHNLATDEVYKAWVAYADSLGDKYKETIAKTVSEYATSAEDEAIAEAFSIVTSPDYAGTLPKEIEHIVSLMFGVKGLENQMTMDERPHEGRKPDGINPLYFASFDFIDMDGEGIQWYDRAKGKYVSFKSYAEKIQYGLECYKIPAALIEALLNIPDKKWDAGDIQSIAMAYYTLGKSPDEIIKEFS